MSVEIITSRQRWLHIFLFLLLPLVRWTDLPDPGWAPRLFTTSLVLLIVTWNLLNFISNDMLRARATVFWILFILWSTVMSMAAHSVGDGLLETLRRGIGFVVAITFGGFLRLDPDRSVRVARWSSLGIGLMSVLFLLDAFSGWFGVNASVAFPSVDYSFGATVGNKNFLAEALLMLVFFVPAGLKDSSKQWRRIALISLSVATLLIFLLQSLAVIIGLLAGFAYYLPRNNSKRNLIRISIPVLVAVVLWSVPSIRHRAFEAYEILESPLQLDRIDSSANNSSYERMLMLKNSKELFRDEPLKGIGVTDWRIDQARYGTGGTLFLNTGLSRFEHPHNEYVLTAVETGIVGLILLSAALFFLFAPVRTSVGGMDVTSSHAAVIAMAVVAFFAYPFSGDVPWYFFMLHVGVLIAAITEPSEPLRGNRLSAGSLFLALIVVMAIIGSFQRMEAEYHQGQGIAAQLGRDRVRSVEEYRKSSTFFYRMDRAGTPSEWYLGNELFRSGDTSAAIDVLESAAERNPYHARVLNDLGSVYEKSGQPEKAISCYAKALKCVPGMTETKLNMAATYYNIGRTEEAFTAIKSVQDVMKLRGNLKETFSQYSLVIARQIALEDRMSSDYGASRTVYVERVWSDDRIRDCLKATAGKADFLDCVRNQ